MKKEIVHVMCDCDVLTRLELVQSWGFASLPACLSVCLFTHNSAIDGTTYSAQILKLYHIIIIAALRECTLITK